MALRRMLVFEQVVEAAPRRDKHTPFNKNNTKSVQHNLENHIKIHNKTVSKALEN